MRNAGGDTITIKIKRETHVELRALVERVTRSGWGSVGLARVDAPTYATVVEAAVAQLKAAAVNVKERAKR